MSAGRMESHSIRSWGWTGASRPRCESCPERAMPSSAVTQENSQLLIEKRSRIRSRVEMLSIHSFRALDLLYAASYTSLKKKKKAAFLLIVLQKSMANCKVMGWKEYLRACTSPPWLRGASSSDLPLKLLEILSSVHVPLYWNHHKLFRLKTTLALSAWIWKPIGSGAVHESKSKPYCSSSHRSKYEQ